MTNPLEKSDLPLIQKLGHVLNRVNIAMRAETWESAFAEGLNPTQGQILLLLGSRETALRLSQLAAELSVTSATVSDSVSTLVEKGFVKKQRDKSDGRAVAVTLTAAGRKMRDRLDLVGKSVSQSLASLSDEEQSVMFQSLTKVVRSLQQNGQIPIGRMCVTCRYFRPNVHADTQRPHHCALVDAPFGERTLRTDCAEHEEADEHLAALNWDNYATDAKPSH